MHAYLGQFARAFGAEGSIMITRSISESICPIKGIRMIYDNARNFDETRELDGRGCRQDCSTIPESVQISLHCSVHASCITKPLSHIWLFLLLFYLKVVVQVYSVQRDWEIFVF